MLALVSRESGLVVLTSEFKLPNEEIGLENPLWVECTSNVIPSVHYYDLATATYRDYSNIDTLKHKTVSTLVEAKVNRLANSLVIDNIVFNTDSGSINALLVKQKLNELKKYNTMYCWTGLNTETRIPQTKNFETAEDFNDFVTECMLNFEETSSDYLTKKIQVLKSNSAEEIKQVEI
jgi:hypothetical protein